MEKFIHSIQFYPILFPSKYSLIDRYGDGGTGTASQTNARTTIFQTNLLLKYQKYLHSTEATASWDTKRMYMHQMQFSRPTNLPDPFRSIDSVSV